MAQEYIINKYSDNLADERTICSKIVNDYATYDQSRTTNLAKSNDVIDEIFFNKSFCQNPDKSEQWKSKIKMCKCYMFYQTLKAFIWRNIYSNPNSMFDVSGESNDSDALANKQKAVLVDILNKMNFQKTCDTIIDNALLYGELISYTAWKKKYEEYRRPIDFFKNLFSKNIEKLPQILNAKKQGKNYWTDIKKTYDNPYIYPVSPADIVFDISQLDDWDACPKIYRTFKTPSDIIDNKFYKVSPECEQYITELTNDNSTTLSQSKKSLKHEIVNGSTVEVLEHWGDFRLPSGKVLKNWHAVVVARKYLVKFEKNEGVINPFTYGTLITDPDSKRGISPLYCIISLAHSQEEFLNRTINLQSLNENPPLIAPEGFFDESEISLYPGKIIEYGDNLSSINAFKQVSFEYNTFLNNIEFLDSLMCEVSGIYPSMIGIQEASTKTATEITTKTQGQMTRLAMILDIINQDFILPCIKNIADLSANFKQGEEVVFVNKNNKQETIVIDDNVRQADYKYTYSDRNTITEKANTADMVVEIAEKFAKYIPLNVQELFVWYFEQKGVENPERFLETDG